MDIADRDPTALDEHAARRSPTSRTPMVARHAGDPARARPPSPHRPRRPPAGRAASARRSVAAQLSPRPGASSSTSRRGAIPSTWAALELSRAGSVIIADNVARGGDVIDAASPDPSVRECAASSSCSRPSRASARRRSRPSARATTPSRSRSSRRIGRRAAGVASFTDATRRKRDPLHGDRRTPGARSRTVRAC